MTFTKFCSFNVNGLGNQRKRTKIFTWLKQNNFEICFLQELHCMPESLENWKKEWGNEMYLSGNSSNSTGVGILLNLNCQYEIMEYKNIITGRLQMLKIRISDTTLVLLNIYGPNTEDITFFRTIENLVIENNSESLILGGDFNNVIDFNLDKINGRIDTNKRCSIQINDMMKDNELCDIYRLKHPNTKRFTWHSNHRPPIFCRLDYFLISSNLLNVVTYSDILPSFLSDHSAVKMILNLCNTNRGPGYFKLNNNILLHTEYKQQLKNAIQETINNNGGSNPNTMWELIKGTVRNESIKYSSKIKKQERKREQEIELELKRLEEKVAENPYNQDILNDLNSERNKLYEITNEKVKGIILRSKAEWVEGTEKNTKYFSNLEKKRSEQKTIKQLVINGALVNDATHILNHVKDFYVRIYSKDSNVDQENRSFFSLTEPKLDEIEKQSCEGTITDYECKLAIQGMKNNKSPGSDGLTAEFYKLYWNDIKDHYINSINYSYENGSLTELQKQGIITLLPKKDKDTLSIDNWRPISLLNVDYKISTKVISNRIKNVLNKLINVNQTGFIKGRYIGENVRTLMEIMEEANENNTPGLIFFADFQKAFDSLDHEFVIKCLNTLNFGESLIQWISLFYKNAKSCISNNGHLSDFFEVKKGVRQGCPLSAYIFILCIELLSRQINDNVDITGLSLGGNEIKQTLFADDASFTLNGSERSFKELIKTLDTFSKISGLKLNKSKCTALKIGRLKYDPSPWCNNNMYKWSNDQASTLGIIFTNNKTKVHELNLIPKIKSFQNCLTNWKKWNLTLIGKITVIKTFALPKLIYPLTVLENPTDETIKQINNTLFDFLWDGKPDKVSRKTIIQNYEHYGLKMINIHAFINSLKCSWIKRLKGKPNHLKNAYNHELQKYGGDIIFKSNLNIKDAHIITNKFIFLNQIINSWCKVNFNYLSSNVSHEILWHNTNIKNERGNTLFYKEWFNRGILYVKHIYDFRIKDFYSFNDLKNIYNIKDGDFLKFYSLKGNIKSEWKKKIKTEMTNNDIPTYLLNTFLASKNNGKMLYDKQIETMRLTDQKHISKWENETNEQDFEWKYIFSVPYKCTISTKLREFQYKYLMRIVPNNSYLFICKLKPSNLCELCNMAVDSNKHLFWECPTIQSFWSGINTLLQTSGLGYNMNLTYEYISFCNVKVTCNKKHILINFIILLAKYFIFKCKCNTTQPAIHNFHTYLNQTIKIEETIASIRNKLDFFHSKWDDFIQANA